ncbi:glycosyltransferase family 4 protein [bacterium]|nr:glycosyltransferase family 4 protein [bacterium]
MSKMKLNILAEKFIGTANGVYTAFLQAEENLKKRDDIDLHINSSDKDFDVVHSHTIGLEYILKSFRWKGKLLVSAHVVPDSFIGSLVFSKLWQPLAKIYLKFVYSLSDVIIAVSPVVKEELQRIGVKKRIEVLCNSVNRKKFKQDDELRAQFRKKLNLKEDAFVAVCVGQIQPRKGVAVFIETAKKCPDITFLWVGGRPYGRLTADYDRLTEVVDSAPDNVVFTGVVDFEDMPGYYAASDVYFFPSLQENFAYATIEASSVKLPLLLRDNPEYVPTLFTHYLKALEVVDFAKELNKLSSDSACLQKWQNESDVLASKYAIEAYMTQLIALYRSVMK